MTEPTQSPPPERPGKAVEPTGYMVLAQEKAHNEAPLTWKVVGSNLTARSAEHAVRIYAEKLGPTVPVVLVAIPARSWRPVTVSAKVTTAFVLEGVPA